MYRFTSFLVLLSVASLSHSQTIVLSEDYGYDHWTSRGPDGTTYDASSARWDFNNSTNPEPTAPTAGCNGPLINKYPVRLRNRDDVTIVKPLVEGHVSLTALWGHIYDGGDCNAAGIFMRDGDNQVVDGARVTRAWDGIRPADRRNNFYTIRNSWVSDVRDDCVEADGSAPGLIEDSLFEGCYAMISMRCKNCSNSSPNTLTIEDSLFHARAYNQSEANGSNPRFASAQPFKIRGNSANVVINNSVFALDTPLMEGADSNTTIMMGDRARGERYGEDLVSCSNNRVLWMNDDNPPQVLQDLDPCFELITGQQAREQWEAARCDWINRHPASVTRRAPGDPETCDDNTDVTDPPNLTSPGNQVDSIGSDISLQLAASAGDSSELVYSAAGLPALLSIDANTGLISGVATAEGTFNVTATVTDDNQRSDGVSFSWTVFDDNEPPVLADPGAQNNVVGDNVSLYLSASDPNGDTLTFAASNLPPPLVLDAQTGLISGAVTTAGVYGATVSVDDGQGRSDSAEITWTVADPIGNIPPVIETPVAQFNQLGETANLQLVAQDSNGDPLQFNIINPPPTLVVDSATGFISGIFTAAGTYNVTVNVEDGEGGTDSASFNWTVTGNGMVLAVANGSFENPVLDDDSVIYQGSEIPGWEITSGNVDIVTSELWSTTDGEQSLDLAGKRPGAIAQTVAGLVAGNSYELVFDYARNRFGSSGNRSASVQVDGIEIGTLVTDQKAPAFTEARFSFVGPADGTIELLFQATSNPGSGIVLDNIRIEDTSGGENLSPDLINPGAQFSAQGETVSLHLSATDGDDDTLSYSASNLPASLSVNEQTGEISGVANTTGSFSITATVDDNNGGVDSENFSWTVSSGGGNALINGSFEADSVTDASEITTAVSGWTVLTGNVELITSQVFITPDGSKALDLNGDQQGSISQAVGGLAPNTVHTLYLAYADQRPRGTSPDLATALVLADGQIIGNIRTTADAPQFVTCNGFEFLSNQSGQVTIELRSNMPGSYGIVVDSVSIAAGRLPEPPESAAIQNGSFEAEYGPDGPHLCGFQLPGWLVTQENIDVVEGVWPAFDGEASLDLGGHGPGGISQTVSGLTPGQNYTLSFAYARHQGWGQQPLTAEVFVNGSLARQLTATTANVPPAWLTESIDLVAPASGELTIEFVSTALTLGGGIVFDDVRLQ